jgi:hypothetical protein
MDNPSSPAPRDCQTRKVFRILSGILAVVILLIGLPVAMIEAQTRSLTAVVLAVCSLFAGIGFAIGAFTGRWFNSPA